MSKSHTIAHYVSNLAQQHQDRKAIYFKSPFRTFSFTYRQIHQRSLEVANYLVEKNVRKGDRVLAWSYNGQEYASILLGCALAGVVVVPIDFNSKADTVSLIADKVDAKLLFHSRRRPYRSTDLPHIYVEDLDQELSGVKIQQTDFDVCDEDIFEIVYTSGTTSDPKGVVITNKNIVSNIMHLQQMWPWKSEYRMLSVLPMSHLFEQVAGFFYPLLFGCSITYLSSRKSSALVGALQQERATMMVVVPAFLQILRERLLRKVRSAGREAVFTRLLTVAASLPLGLRRVLFRKVHQNFGGRLRYFLTGGAALDPDLEAWWSALGFVILQGYGLTEASPVVTFNTPAYRRAGSVGRVLPDQELKLDAQQEIWIRGDNITPGYYQNPEENEARFEEGWYRTGDVGTVDEDGYVFLRGRLKNMIVSSSGLNVYPEDIEVELAQEPGVLDCCVLGVDQDGDTRVHAVLLMNKELPLESNPLRSIIDRVNQRLQPQQQIQAYTQWPHDDFPRTHTLKIKRKPILEEIQQGVSSATENSSSSGDRLLDMLAELAKVNVESIREDSCLTTDLGLDSLARVELATTLEEEFNIEIDDQEVTGQVKVGQLRDRIQTRVAVTDQCLFPEWATRRPARILRGVMQSLVLRIPSLFSRTTVQGREHLQDIEAPAIFICNHVCHYDVAYIMRALPRRHRKIAVAAAAEIVYGSGSHYRGLRKLLKRLNGLFTTLVVNTFPFYRETHVKKSFEYMGTVMDKGWHILLFPEGRLTETGQMYPFQAGIGLLAQSMHARIVPLHLDGLYEISDHQSWIPKKVGRVTVTFGNPIEVDPVANPQEVAKMLEGAVKDLGSNAELED